MYLISDKTKTPLHFKAIQAEWENMSFTIRYSFVPPEFETFILMNTKGPIHEFMYEEPTYFRKFRCTPEFLTYLKKEIE